MIDDDEIDEYVFGSVEDTLDGDIPIENVDINESTFDCSDKVALGSLTLEDLCDKTKTIFEKVVGKQISLNFSDSSNESYISNILEDNNVYISVSTKKSNIPAYTRFNHELSHYAFDSLSTDFGLLVESELKAIPLEHIDKALELYKSVFNILEDQRVESLMSKVYRGVGKRFESMRKTMGEHKDSSYTLSPIDYLHYAREYREDLIPNEMKGVIEMLKKVEYRDKIASIVVAKEFINRILNPWIIENIKNVKPKTDNLGNCIGSEKIDEEKGTESTNQLDKAFTNQFVINRNSDHRDLNQVVSSDHIKKVMKELEFSSQEEILNNAKQSIKSRIDEIKAEIEKIARNSPVSTHPESRQTNIITSTHKTNFSINKPLAKELNTVFKYLQEKNKDKISDTGNSIDISSYIQSKSRGYGDYYVNVKPKSSFSIVIGVDTSGSMKERIDSARNMLATMFKSLEKIKGIKLEAFCWNSRYNTCDIIPIKNLNDCRLVNLSAGGGGTPTLSAVLYGHEILKKTHSKNKLFILMTDESPKESEITDEIKSAKKHDKITSMCIGFNCYDDGGFEMAFGKSYAVVNDIVEANKKVVDMVSNSVISTLRGKSQ